MTKRQNILTISKDRITYLGHDSLANTEADLFRILFITLIAQLKRK